jgi:hypothetical protein
MGSSSKELWAILILCIPIMIWQASVFFPANWIDGYFIIVFEVVLVGSSSYLIWRYGGIAETVTKILEVTRVWDASEPRIAVSDDYVKASNSSEDAQEFSSSVFCSRCGYRMKTTAKFCRRCGASAQ